MYDKYSRDSTADDFHIMLCDILKTIGNTQQF